MTIRIIEGLGEVADRYALFLVDQWGVLHDGESPHDGAIEALRALRAAGKKVVILSNTSKRLALTLPRMAAMGFGDDCYDHCVTSGEEVWQALKARTEPFYAALGHRCYLFSWDGDTRLFDGLDLTGTGDIDEADFILNAGTTSGTLDLSAYEPILQRAVVRDLPMICANPDFVAVAPDGSLAICPGATARRYEELGGRVDYRGKPHAPVYTKSLEHEPQARPVLAIGDSLYHDIGGANRAGVDSLFVVSGIHGGDLDLAEGTLDPDRLDAVCQQEGQTPTYAMTKFRW
ncbi:MAG: TIGR01459 family HAD-type hydrolase [Alphaproteobacteria bacterium]|nr:TIGR01459 family HAD-type hydrolase [Alphaproteobacteria bacterium]